MTDSKPKPKPVALDEDQHALISAHARRQGITIKDFVQAACARQMQADARDAGKPVAMPQGSRAERFGAVRRWLRDRRLPDPNGETAKAIQAWDERGA